MNLGTICQDFMHQADALEELCGAYEAALCMVRGIGAKLQVEPGLGRPVAAAARAQPKPMKSQADTTTSIAPQAGGLESCVAAPTTAAQFGKGPASTAAGGPASQALNEPPGASDNAPPAATASGSGAFVPDRVRLAACENGQQHRGAQQRQAPAPASVPCAGRLCNSPPAAANGKPADQAHESLAELPSAEAAAQTSRKRRKLDNSERRDSSAAAAAQSALKAQSAQRFAGTQPADLGPAAAAPSGRSAPATAKLDRLGKVASATDPATTHFGRQKMQLEHAVLSSAHVPAAEQQRQPGQAKQQGHTSQQRPHSPPGMSGPRPEDSEGSKLCPRCKQPKPFSQFYRSVSSADGLDRRCKVCENLRCKERRKRRQQLDAQLRSAVGDDPMIPSRRQPGANPGNAALSPQDASASVVIELSSGDSGNDEHVSRTVPSHPQGGARHSAVKHEQADSKVAAVEAEQLAEKQRAEAFDAAAFVRMMIGQQPPGSYQPAAPTTSDPAPPGGSGWTQRPADAAVPCAPVPSGRTKDSARRFASRAAETVASPSMASPDGRQKGVSAQDPLVVDDSGSSSSPSESSSSGEEDDVAELSLAERLRRVRQRAAAAKEAEAAKQAPSHPAGHVAMPAKVQTVQGNGQARPAPAFDPGTPWMRPEWLGTPKRDWNPIAQRWRSQWQQQQQGGAPTDSQAPSTAPSMASASRAAAAGASQAASTSSAGATVRLGSLSGAAAPRFKFGQLAGLTRQGQPPAAASVQHAAPGGPEPADSKAANPGPPSAAAAAAPTACSEVATGVKADKGSNPAATVHLQPNYASAAASPARHGFRPQPASHSQGQPAAAQPLAPSAATVLVRSSAEAQASSEQVDLTADDGDESDSDDVIILDGPPKSSGPAEPPPASHRQAQQPSAGTEPTAHTQPSSTTAAQHTPKAARQTAADHRFDAARQPENVSPGVGLRHAADHTTVGTVAGGSGATAAETGPAGGVVELQRETAWQEAGYAELEADEWERRRLEVARQAEEARRLKKQRRQAAETQQRLTARLEDHRAALAHQQSQAVEKDRLRTIVRQRLQKKVARAKTMHAVLCALGIPVAQGTLVVTKDLVQKAYKKALLQYHPDRHASKPLEVQIECEEIFKLLNSRAAR